MFTKSVAVMTLVAAAAGAPLPRPPKGNAPAPISAPTTAPFEGSCAFVSKEQLDQVNALFPGGSRDICTASHVAAFFTDPEEILGGFMCGLAGGLSSKDDLAAKKANCEKAEYGKQNVKNCVYVVYDGVDSGDCVPQRMAEFLKTKAGQQQKKCNTIYEESECGQDADCTWALEDVSEMSEKNLEKDKLVSEIQDNNINIPINNADIKHEKTPMGECKGKLFAAQMEGCAAKTREECSSGVIVQVSLAAISAVVAALIL